MSTPPDDDKTMIRPSRGVAPPVAAAAGSEEAVPITVAPATPRPPVNSASSTAASSAGDSGNALAMGTYLAEFELTSVIGEGGFGIVYNAWDHSLERRVALKEYMPASLAARESTQVRLRSQRHKETFDAGLKSFINEAKLLAQFDHASLVKVYRFWEANGTAYMVMPLYQGITLKDKLRALPEPPDEAWLMGMLAPLTEALAVIHAENCFHRDIAPDNVILLEGSERPLLLDFGAARRVIGDMTQALTVILKPGYAPVEQYAETPNMKQGAWTDIYALAASVHYAVLGRTPPPSVSRLMSDSFVPLAQSAAGRYSERFLAAMDRALCVRPEERTQSIAALREDLGLEALSANEQITRMRTVVAAPPASARPAAAADDEKTVMAPRAAPSPALPGAAAVATPASRTGLWAGVGAAVLALVAAGGYVALGGKPAKPAAAPSTVASVADPAPAAIAPPATAEAPRQAPGPFSVQAEFDKVMAVQTASFNVVAVPTKPQLRIGRDKLAFEIVSSRDGYVHVLLLGPDKQLLLFYPNANTKDQHIKAGQRLKLPEASWPLTADEPPGPEHFLVVVSASPRDFSALTQGNEYIFKKMRADAELATLSAAAPSGRPLLLGAPAANCGTDCDTFGAALFSLEVVR